MDTVSNMDWTDNDVRLFWEISTPYIEKIVINSMLKNGVLMRIPASVVSADNSKRYANVQLLSSDQTMWLMNCSGVDLKTGDNVWVDYMYSLDNAYIAVLNNGKAWGW